MNIIDVKNIVPERDGVIIKEFEKDTVTESGLELPESSTAGTPVIGQVIAVGEHSHFKVGDIVLFRRYSVDELTFQVDGKKQTVNFLTDSEVVAHVKKDE